MLLPTRLINITGEFLYPAYATYKSLNRRPADHAELERWLMYWSVVGAWTAAEGVVGWFLEWIPLYTLTKTVIFLYLASPATGGTPYVYNAVLAPLFAEHEPEIDAFLTSLRGRAGSGARGGLGWIWETVRKALGLSTEQATQLSNAAGVPAFPAQPAAADPSAGAGAAQGAYSYVSGFAARYLPSALAAVTAAAQSATSSAGGPAASSSSNSSSSGSGFGARGFDVPPPTPPTVPAPVTHAGSRTFQYAAEEVFTASISRGGVVESRTPSSGSLSGGSNLAASGFAEIHREEAEGAEDMARSPGGGWMRWSSYKDKAE